MRATILAGLAILAAGAAFTVPAAMARNSGHVAAAGVSPNNTLVVETRVQLGVGDGRQLHFTGGGIADARPGSMIVALGEMTDQASSVTVTLAAPLRVRRDGRFEGAGRADVNADGLTYNVPLKVTGGLRFTEGGLVLEGTFHSIKLGSNAGRSVSGQFRAAQGDPADRD